MSATKRHARFDREALPPLRLTERDFGILRAVHRHRLLSSRHLASLAGGSPQRVLRRLQSLFHHGYLDRPRAQLDWYTKGSKPMVYALGRKGAKAIGGPGSRWTAKNRQLGRSFLDHTLAVADALVNIELACKEAGGPKFVPEEELRASLPGDVRPGGHPFRMRVSFRYRGRRETLGVIPDAVFALRYADRPPGQEAAYFFLEVDRGTMPVARKNLLRTSLARKYLAYHAAWKQGLHARLFGFPNFRVLMVTRTEPRRRNLERALPGILGSDKRLFVFKAAPGTPRDEPPGTPGSARGARNIWPT